MMRRAHFLLPVPLAVLAALAQPPSPPGDEEEIRSVFDEAAKAWREGGWQRAMPYFSERVSYLNPTGSRFDRTYMSRQQGPSRTRRAHFVRHVQFLTADSAVAVGVWRDTGTRTPFAAGNFDYTFVREKGGWKIATMHEGFLTPIDSVSVPGGPVDVDSEGILSSEERTAGWRALFDGRTSNGWLTVSGKNGLPPCWRIDGDCLVTVPDKTQMALRTQEKFRSFEMSFEWLMSKAGNSGVKYRVFAVELFAGGAGGEGAGYEYQLADDDNEPGARADPRQRSGAVYGVTSVAVVAARPVGEWNRSRILVAEDHVEHWLNGVETARFPVDVQFESPILLQHHRSEVRFRNLKIRPLGSR